MAGEAAATHQDNIRPFRQPSIARRSPGRRGPISIEEMALRICHALRHLDDRIELNRNPLTGLPVVQDLAQTQYAICIHPSAVALRRLVRRAVAETLADIEREPSLAKVKRFLELYASGSSIKAASMDIGLSREHCSRVLKKRAALLVAERFTRIIRKR